MPAHYAHYRFGKQVLKAMPPEARQCIQRFRRLYDAGLYGPDIFFYSNPFRNTDDGEPGRRFHAMTGAEFFPAACKAVSSEAARAYLYGLLAHYCLDSLCNPFISRLDAIGEASHRQLEAEFERHLLVSDGEVSPEHYDTGKKLRLTRGECMTVAEFYPEATGGTVSRCVRTLSFAARFLSGGDPAKRKALLERFLPALAQQVIPPQEQEELALYVLELDSLYRQALSLYPRLLAALTAHMETGEALGAEFEKDFG